MASIFLVEVLTGGLAFCFLALILLPLNLMVYNKMPETLYVLGLTWLLFKNRCLSQHMLDSGCLRYRKVCSLFFVLQSAATDFACMSYNTYAVPSAAHSTLKITGECI
jgi:hypothetical protein